DLSKLAVAPSGTPIFNTRYGNIAPRLGLAYQISQARGWEAVLKGGWGLFFDLATAQLPVFTGSYPFGANKQLLFTQFPLSSSDAAPPTVTAAHPSVRSLDPNLKVPYTQEWNLSFEQALGAEQSFSLSYVGALGRRLLGTES